MASWVRLRSSSPCNSNISNNSYSSSNSVHRHGRVAIVVKRKTRVTPLQQSGLGYASCHAFCDDSINKALVY